MKSYEKMAEDALERISRHEIEQKKRKQTLLKIGAPVLSLCLVAAIGTGLWKSGQTSPEIPEPVSKEEVNPPVTSDIIETENAVRDDIKPETQGQVASSGNIVIDTIDTKGAVDESGFCHFLRDGISVTGRLKEALDNNPGSKLAVNAIYRPTTADINNFIYEGKTLAEIAIAADNERIMPEKMLQLLKLGDELKYGKALYETGTPSGEKWDKRLYEETVNFLGEELLSRYIVDGDFFKDKLEQDIATYNETSAQELYKLAYIAYMEEFMKSAEQKLFEGGIKTDRKPYMDSGIIVYAAEEQLKTLPLENPKSWYFDLGPESIK